MAEPGYRFALARYSTDGTLDRSFSGNGRATTRFIDHAEAHAVALQADGKIVAAGAAGIRSRVALARYNTDGTLDRSFSGDGKVTTMIGSLSEAVAVAIQADGKIVAAGDALKDGQNLFALARYNVDGSLDPSFDEDGRVTTSSSDGSPHSWQGVAIQFDGKIVAAGILSTAQGSAFALVRYNLDGSLDPAFGGDGMVTTIVGRGAIARALAIQPDGKIVVVGQGIGREAVRKFQLARYNTDGTLDGSFGGDGTVRTRFGDEAGALGVAIHRGGGIVAAGWSRIGGLGLKFGLVRYNPDGTLDVTFGGDGKVRTGFPTGFPGFDYSVSTGVAIQTDDKIVAAGFVNTQEAYKVALARYLGA